MNIYFLKYEAVENIKNSIEENIEKYQKSKSDWIKEEFFGKYDKNFQDFQLNISKEKPQETDFENIKILYLNLKELKDSQAADERVWAGLCHKEFWSYMKYRWPPINETVIKNHYFFGKDHPKFNNGLARLWWIGRLTYDENLKDPFELTKYACKDFNGKSYPLFVVNIGNNKKLIRIILRTFMEFEKKRELTRKEFNQIKEIIVSWGGKMILDSLSPEELSQKINQYLNEVILKNRKNKPKITKKKKVVKKSKIKIEEKKRISKTKKIISKKDKVNPKNKKEKRSIFKLFK